jgi:flagellar protein FliO/FliZ
MLQSLSGLLNDDGRAVQIALGVVVVVVLIGLLYVLYRLLFAHRLRAPSGTRARGSRLGVVDVYGLDGQRQLVIVRRDNVEHLLMIGGPNDVVVEGNIVRSATNGAREAAKPAAPPQNEQPTELPPAPFPRPAAPAAVANVMKRAFSLRTEPPLATPVESTRQDDVTAVEPIVKPEPRQPAKAANSTVIPLTSRGSGDPPPTARSASEAKPAPAPVEPPPAVKAAPEPPPRRAPPPKPAEPPAPRPALPSPIAPLRPRPLPAAEAARPNPSPPPVEPPPKPAEPAPPAPVAPAPVSTVAAEAGSADKPAQRKEEAFYDLESLEAEMARLLGRDG